MTTQIPNQNEIQQLGDAIATDGIEPHFRRLEALAGIAEPTGLYPGAVAVLQDRASAAAPKARAFMVLARNWETIQRNAARPLLDHALADLLSSWTSHESIRAERTPVSELWHSNRSLDAVRAKARLAAAQFSV